MNKKKNIIILLCAIIILFLSGFVYKKFSTPKFKDLDASWGLGVKVTKSVSNNRDYEWYVDQCFTGRNSEKNCGPSVLEMSARWQCKESNIQVSDIVDKYIPDETAFLGVYFTELYKWMEDYKLNPTWLKDATVDSIINELNRGNILIVVLDLQQLKYNYGLTQRIGKPYDLKGAHYVIIKGYKEVDNKLYFEIYDPISANMRYADGQLIGIDRYYDTEELMNSIKCYFPDIIIVSPKK